MQLLLHRKISDVFQAVNANRHYLSGEQFGVKKMEQQKVLTDTALPAFIRQEVLPTLRTHKGNRRHGSPSIIINADATTGHVTQRSANHPPGAGRRRHPASLRHGEDVASQTWIHCTKAGSQFRDGICDYSTVIERQPWRLPRRIGH